MSEESKMLPKSVEAVPTLKVLEPCLRPRSAEKSPRKEPRKVSFPEEESKLVTGYLEPANPWEYDNASREDLVSTYKASCEKHGTAPLENILNQLMTLDIDAIRNECLNLKGEILAASQCETLEEVLKRVQFRNINLEATSLDDEGSVALFDMVEYYESAINLNISSNKNIGVRGWQACSRMIKKTRCLEQLEARNVTLNEQFMPILSRALRIGTQLQILKLENCHLTGRPIIILAAALKLNTGLRELYLADNNLGVTDAIQLGGLLRTNFTLQLLDISNNNIQDTGLGHISDGLTDQTPGQSGSGLSILVMWNNHLTRNASKHFARAVARSQTLETLNIGQNMLTNECLHVMKDSLQQNRTLLRLGMQSTHLTCEGAIALAECIADNTVIQRIDLRDNNLKVAGLMALALSMKVNTSVTQLDLDNTPKKKVDEEDNTLEQYLNLVSEIRGYCSRNEISAREEEDTIEEGPTTETPGRGRISSSTSRKISLTCETLLRTTAMPPQPIMPESGLLAEPRRGSSGRLRSPAPSPIPSPVSSPVPSPSRTRFQVSRVTESSPFLSTGPSGSPTSTSSSPITPPSLSSSPSRFFPSPTTSRFRVTLVESSAPPPTVTSPSGNVTIGFSFKQNGADSTNNSNPSAMAPQIQVVNSPDSETEGKGPEIVVTSTSIGSQVVASMTPSSQNVTVTVKLDPDSDSLIIENEPSPSAASDMSDDTADMEVRRIMESESFEDSTWAGCNVQDSVTLLRRAGKVNSEKEVAAHFMFPNISDKNTSILEADEEKSTASTRVSQESSDEGMFITQMPKESFKDVPDNNSVKSDTYLESNSKHASGTLQSLTKQPVPVENNVKQIAAPVAVTAPPPPQRTRKISWIAPVESEEPKQPSSLEKLLGLFHNPGSFFKTQQQYKATAAIANQQPVSSSNSNSNASFLLTSGPPSIIANGGSGIVTSGSSGRAQECTEVLKDSHRPSAEANAPLKQTPGIFVRERRVSKSENPIPDIINNNNRVQEVTALGHSVIGNDDSAKYASEQSNVVEERQCGRRLCEDVNYNVSKLYEGNAASSISQSAQAVSCRSSQPLEEVGTGFRETSAQNCDSKFNLISRRGEKGSENIDTSEAEDVEKRLDSLKLVDAFSTVDDRLQCTTDERGTELKLESNAIKNSSPNGIDIKTVPHRSESNSVDLANRSPANNGLTGDKLSRSCESSFTSLQSATATVRLVGGASRFTSYELLRTVEMTNQMDKEETSSLLLQDCTADIPAQPIGKEVEAMQSSEVPPTNTL